MRIALPRHPHRRLGPSDNATTPAREVHSTAALPIRANDAGHRTRVTSCYRAPSAARAVEPCPCANGFSRFPGGRASLSPGTRGSSLARSTSPCAIFSLQYRRAPKTGLSSRDSGRVLRDGEGTRFLALPGPSDAEGQEVLRRMVRRLRRLLRSDLEMAQADRRASDPLTAAQDP